MIDVLWQKYPDGVLPDSMYKLSKETGIYIYDFRKRVKSAYGMRLELYLAQRGFVSIPLS